MDELDVIINNMKTKPDTWYVDEFWARHKSGLAIWIGNGFWGCHIKKPEFREFNIIDRFRLFRTIKKIEKRDEE